MVIHRYQWDKFLLKLRAHTTRISSVEWKWNIKNYRGYGQAFQAPSSLLEVLKGILVFVHFHMPLHLIHLPLKVWGHLIINLCEHFLPVWLQFLLSSGKSLQHLVQNQLLMQYFKKINLKKKTVELFVKIDQSHKKGQRKLKIFVSMYGLPCF